MTDQQLVQQIQDTNSPEAFAELKNRHLSLCTDRMKPYWSLLCSMGYSSNEILHERDLAISRAIRTYSPKSGAAVNTWIGNNVRYWFLNMLKGFGKKNQETFLDDKKEFEAHEKFNISYDLTDFVNRTLEDLGPRVKLVFQKRYVLNQKVKDISRETGIPKHKIAKMNKDARNYLKTKIEETELAFPDNSTYN